ncbi:hypothetical protein JXA34_01780 [Patescibacteria group bacterium]|nr:hypothetical protein [Patescibacteria group bacterium]
MEPVTVFIRGLPGLGKSTLAHKLSGITNFKIINPDDINTESSDYIEFAHSLNVKRLKNIKYRYNLHQAINYLLNGINIIWEQPWRKISNISITIENIRNKTPTRYIILEFPLDIDKSWRERENRFSSKQAFKKYVSKWQPLEENRNTVLVHENISISDLINRINSTV